MTARYFSFGGGVQSTALLVLAAQGRLTFCDCRAGEMYKRFLRGRYADLRDGKDAVSSDMAEALTEAVTTPSVRYEGGKP